MQLLCQISVIKQPTKNWPARQVQLCVRKPPMSNHPTILRLSRLKGRISLLYSVHTTLQCSLESPLMMMGHFECQVMVSPHSSFLTIFLALEHTPPLLMSIVQYKSLNLICQDRNSLNYIFCHYLQHLLFGFAFWPGRLCPPFLRSIFDGSSRRSFWSFFDLRTRVVMDLNISSTLMLSLADVSNS